jgi:hypothetical protein
LESDDGAAGVQASAAYSGKRFGQFGQSASTSQEIRIVAFQVVWTS